MEMREVFTKSYLHTYFVALGPTFALLLPISALVAFVLTLLLVRRGRGEALGPALLIIVPMPVYVGTFAAIYGVLSFLPPIPKLNTQPSHLDVAFELWMADICVFSGMLLSTPAYLTAVIGTTIRSFRGT
jgi:hypothetical protein